MKLSIHRVTSYMSAPDLTADADICKIADRVERRIEDALSAATNALQEEYPTITFNLHLTED